MGCGGMQKGAAAYGVQGLCNGMRKASAKPLKTIQQPAINNDLGASKTSALGSCLIAPERKSNEQGNNKRKCLESYITPRTPQHSPKSGKSSQEILALLAITQAHGSPPH